MNRSYLNFEIDNLDNFSGPGTYFYKILQSDVSLNMFYHNYEL